MSLPRIFYQTRLGSRVGLREGLIASLLNDVPKLDLPMRRVTADAGDAFVLEARARNHRCDPPVHGLRPAAINPIRAAAHLLL